VAYSGDGFSFPFVWAKVVEGGRGNDFNDFDVDLYAIKPSFMLGGATLTPTIAYLYSKDGEGYIANTDEIGVWFAGLDADVKFGSGSSFWFTGIYEGGSIDLNDGVDKATLDVGAYLLALGATINMGALDIHGQAFYATGDDEGTLNESEQFVVPGDMQMYYWSEIMGKGLFDNQVSANSCGDDITNIEAVNIGIGLAMNDKVKLTADIWHARLVEVAAGAEETLGTEVDLKLTYAVMRNLNLDLVGAYLLAGDATYKKLPGGDDESNPYEVGAKLSFNF
jgi:hypothetical protein